MLTEQGIQNSLMSRYWHSLLLVPNYTPPNWFECDLYRVTINGYAIEYEIKRTLGDLKADVKKAALNVHYGWDEQKQQMVYSMGRGEPKRVRLERGEGPRNFYYVLPENLASRAEVPTFAGLILFDTDDCITIERQAKDLHDRKVEEQYIAKARYGCYHRYLRHFQNGKIVMLSFTEGDGI